MEQVAAAAVVAERDRLLDELRRAWDGDPWHGSSFASLLEGLDAEQALARPVANAHSIWEIVLHSRNWTLEVARRLRDGVARAPAGGDWPRAGGGTSAWPSAVASFARAHQELLAAVENFPEARLDERVGDARDAPLGAGVTYAVMLHGLAQHHAYHAGQVALLRKAHE